MSVDLLTAGEAAALLGVSRRTLYAYVSRGLVRSEPGPGPSRARRYPRAALEALLADRARRGDPELAAHGALSWGLPVVDSALTLVRDGRIHYRGRDVERLADTASFEEVAALLWDADPASLAWPAGGAGGSPGDPVGRLAEHLASAAGRSLITPGTGGAAADAHAARLVAGLAAVLGGACDGPLARRLAAGWGVPDAAEDLDAALILSADHELNASAFAARVVASADARLEHALLAALCAFSGRRHGGMTERAEALLEDSARLGPTRALERALAGGDVPGFGHPLYPLGDPRGTALVARADAAGPDPAVTALLDAAREQLGLLPNLDMGLAVLARRRGLPADAATALFALGRSAGWIAHAREAGRGELIRPRARYTGPEPAAA